MVPRELKGKYADGSDVSLNTLWNRRQTTKFNGASYIAQKGAAAIYTPEGISSVKAATDYYLGNAAIIKQAFIQAGYKAFGGEDSPYVWVYAGEGVDSWGLFDQLLRVCGFSTTPGSGFGTKGDGYVRLTGFNSRENTEKAMLALLNREKD